MRRFFCYFLLVSFAGNVFGQDTTVATVDSRNYHLKPEISNFSWNAKLTNGIQRSYFFDIGISRTSFMGSPHGVFGTAVSLCYSMFPSFNTKVNTVHGVKGSMEVFGSLMGFGLDMAYYATADRNDFFITPKALLGISSINLYYGYNFSTNNYEISDLGKHTFGLQINLPFYTKNKLNNTVRKGFHL